MWILSTTIIYEGDGDDTAYNLETGASSTDAAGAEGGLDYGAASADLAIIPASLKVGGGRGEVMFHCENRGTAAAYFVPAATLDTPPDGESEPLTPDVVAAGDTVLVGPFLWMGNGSGLPRLRCLDGADVKVTARYRGV